MINLIVAFDQNRVIGHQNQLPWHLSADLQHFKKLTLGHVVVMGRKTYESMGRALPGRTNIVITRNPDFKVEDATVYTSFHKVFSDYAKASEIFIIGGAELFQASFPYLQRLYITKIHATFKGDTYFPPYDESQWQCVEQEYFEPDQKNIYPYEFMTFLSRNL